MVRVIPRRALRLAIALVVLALGLFAARRPQAFAQPGVEADRARRQRAQGLVEEGLQHERAGDLGSAIGYYREAVAAWPGGIVAYAQLGEGYLARGDDQDALAAFDAGLARHPDALRLLLGRAKALEDLRRLDEAAEALRRATRRTRDSTDAWRERARLAQRRGAWLEALFAWRALLDVADAAGPTASQEPARAEARTAIPALRRLTRGMDPAEPTASPDDPILRALSQLP